MSWLLWLILAALLVLPVLLRLRVGDEGPDNAITHESGDDQEDGRGEGDAGPAGLLAAA
jgi:hypothetical protein